MQKPNRFLRDRVASYAEEGSAYLRRRRIRSQPFARVWREGEAVEAWDADRALGRALFKAAEELIETTRPER